MNNKKPKVLFLDIETMAILSYNWGIYDQSAIKIKKDWELLSLAWKWQGSKKVHCITRQNKDTDLNVAKKAHELLSQADICSGHNGDQFDLKKLKARMLFHGLEPIKPTVSVDTKKMVKSVFNLTSNSLNHIAQYLGLGQKIKHSGFELWEGCEANDPKAWKMMIKYNKMDVVLLEKVYNKLVPWMKNHPNMALLQGKNVNEGCNKCGSSNVVKDGLHANTTTINQRLKCKDCKGYFLRPLKKVVKK